MADEPTTPERASIRALREALKAVTQDQEEAELEVERRKVELDRVRALARKHKDEADEIRATIEALKNG